MAAAETNTGGVTKQELINLGRPNGPDLQLKFNPDDALQFQVPAAGTITTDGIIREDSSITEVLNVLSFLISTGRAFADIVDDENSAATAGQAGQINQDTGYYADAAKGAFQVFPAVIFNLNTLSVTAPAAGSDVHFPVSILKRRGDVAADVANPISFQAGMDAKLIENATATDSVKALFVDSVKQMIKILTQTRKILGPRGWTDLFQKVTGGSSANKKAKRTHRHRRRYSSKQY